MYPLYSLSLFISFVRLGSCAYNLTNGTNSTTPTSSGQFPLTTDESCGADVGRMCVINGIFPFCSGNGFCGGDDQYCGQTCQPEYGSCVKPNSTLGNPACSWANSGNSPRCDGRCGADFGGRILWKYGSALQCFRWLPKWLCWWKFNCSLVVECNCAGYGDSCCYSVKYEGF
ncbi:hypothetical protein K490DRAFT_56298 [Saccharata proteae CBS 121410]|uniref:Carbohydrate-binding module family 18 protein n=1 Tax=Saccharata proteae CBS 121410 TaxID=1314787 RepID=A0A9P4HWY8_9PEZI|nr:hypothetical protein K490DRAFT_56298 [Saccharata proteae CBS 121410]